MKGFLSVETQAVQPEPAVCWVGIVPVFSEPCATEADTYCSMHVHQCSNNLGQVFQTVAIHCVLVRHLLGPRLSQLSTGQSQAELREVLSQWLAVHARVLQCQT